MSAYHLGVLEEFLPVRHRNVARDTVRHIGYRHEVALGSKLTGNAPGEIVDAAAMVHQHDRRAGRAALWTVEIDVHRTSIHRD